METYTKAKPLVANEQFQAQRGLMIQSLKLSVIDEPIRDLISGFIQCPHCFPLQSCYGHFLYPGQSDPHNLDTLPEKTDLEKVEYRIAYLAFCVENSDAGLDLLESLKQVTEIDESNIQFGSAQWFWNQQVNSYVLQVEPYEFRDRDKALVSYEQALTIQATRRPFFDRVRELIGPFSCSL